MRYDELPASLRGSPGALGRFRWRRAMTVDPWAVFAFMSVAVVGLVGMGHLRRLIGEL